jgi:hypothetical protein
MADTTPLLPTWPPPRRPASCGSSPTRERSSPSSSVPGSPPARRSSSTTPPTDSGASSAPAHSCSSSSPMSPSSSSSPAARAVRETVTRLLPLLREVPRHLLRLLLDPLRLPQSFTVMISGAGAVFEEYYGLSKFIGGIALAAVVGPHRVVRADQPRRRHRQDRPGHRRRRDRSGNLRHHARSGGHLDGQCDPAEPRRQPGLVELVPLRPVLRRVLHALARSVPHRARQDREEPSRGHGRRPRRRHRLLARLHGRRPRTAREHGRGLSTPRSRCSSSPAASARGSGRSSR